MKAHIKIIRDDDLSFRNNNKGVCFKLIEE